MSIPFVDQDSFQQAINNNKKIVVKFGAPWCGPCKMMAPMLDKMSDEFTDIAFLEVNVDEQPMLAAKYGVRSLPTIIAFKDGILLWTKIGAPSPNDLRKALESI